MDRNGDENPEGENEEEAGSEAGGEADVEGEEEQKETQTAVATGPKKKLTNQFNFCERAALTYNSPSRSVETQTVPPPRSSFSANVVQWHIYDSYNEDYERQKREKEKEMLKEKKPGLQKHAEMKRGDAKTKAAEEFNRKYFQKAQVLERMVNQNIFDEIAHGSYAYNFDAINRNYFCLTHFVMQIIVIGKIRRMNIVKTMELYCHYGNLHMINARK